MFQLSENGQKVFDARYARRDNAGQVIETFPQAVQRLAHTAALVEQEDQWAEWEERFARVIGNLLFVPSTPIWANMGKPDRPWQPGACFVLDAEDSLHSMYQTLHDTDSGVSKTCNLPNSATLDDIDQAYHMAHQLRIKGLTVFRDGCKQGTVTVGQARELRCGEILSRPVSAQSMTHRLWQDISHRQPPTGHR